MLLLRAVSHGTELYAGNVHDLQLGGCIEDQQLAVLSGVRWEAFVIVRVALYYVSTSVCHA